MNALHEGMNFDYGEYTTIWMCFMKEWTSWRNELWLRRMHNYMNVLHEGMNFDYREYTTIWMCFMKKWTLSTENTQLYECAFHEEMNFDYGEYTTIWMRFMKKWTLITENTQLYECASWRNELWVQRIHNYMNAFHEEMNFDYGEYTTIWMRFMKKWTLITENTQLYECISWRNELWLWRIHNYMNAFHEGMNFDYGEYTTIWMCFMKEWTLITENAQLYECVSWRNELWLRRIHNYMNAFHEGMNFDYREYTTIWMRFMKEWTLITENTQLYECASWRNELWLQRIHNYMNVLHEGMNFDYGEYTTIWMRFMKKWTLSTENTQLYECISWRNELWLRRIHNYMNVLHEEMNFEYREYTTIWMHFMKKWTLITENTQLYECASWRNELWLRRIHNYMNVLHEGMNFDYGEYTTIWMCFMKEWTLITENAQLYECASWRNEFWLWRMHNYMNALHEGMNFDYGEYTTIWMRFMKKWTLSTENTQLYECISWRNELWLRRMHNYMNAFHEEMNFDYGEYTTIWMRFMKEWTLITENTQLYECASWRNELWLQRIHNYMNVLHEGMNVDYGEYTTIWMCFMKEWTLITENAQLYECVSWRNELWLRRIHNYMNAFHEGMNFDYREYTTIWMRFMKEWTLITENTQLYECASWRNELWLRRIHNYMNVLHEGMNFDYGEYTTIWMCFMKEWTLSTENTQLYECASWRNELWLWRTHNYMNALHEGMNFDYREYTTIWMHFMKKWTLITENTQLYECASWRNELWLRRIHNYMNAFHEEMNFDYREYTTIWMCFMKKWTLITENTQLYECASWRNEFWLWRMHNYMNAFHEEMNFDYGECTTIWMRFMKEWILITENTQLYECASWRNELWLQRIHNYMNALHEGMNFDYREYTTIWMRFMKEWTLITENTQLYECSSWRNELWLRRMHNYMNVLHEEMNFDYREYTTIWMHFMKEWTLITENTQLYECSSWRNELWLRRMHNYMNVLHEGMNFDYGECTTIWMRFMKEWTLITENAQLYECISWRNELWLRRIHNYMNVLHEGMNFDYRECTTIWMHFMKEWTLITENTQLYECISWRNELWLRRIHNYMNALHEGMNFDYRECTTIWMCFMKEWTLITENTQLYECASWRNELWLRRMHNYMNVLHEGMNFDYGEYTTIWMCFMKEWTLITENTQLYECTSWRNELWLRRMHNYMNALHEGMNFDYGEYTTIWMRFMKKWTLITENTQLYECASWRNELWVQRIHNYMNALHEGMNFDYGECTTIWMRFMKEWTLSTENTQLYECTSWRNELWLRRMHNYMNALHEGMNFEYREYTTIWMHFMKEWTLITENAQLYECASWRNELWLRRMHNYMNVLHEGMNFDYGEYTTIWMRFMKDLINNVVYVSTSIIKWTKKMAVRWLLKVCR